MQFHLQYDTLNPFTRDKFRSPRNKLAASGFLGGRLATRVRNETRGAVVAERVEIADTSSKRRTGLLKHDSLAEGQALWIVPCEGVHTFGMKFPIDVIFLSKKRVILKMRKNMASRRIAICLRAHSVLELPAGTIEKTGSAPGDQLAFEKA